MIDEKLNDACMGFLIAIKKLKGETSTMCNAIIDSKLNINVLTEVGIECLHSVMKVCHTNIDYENETENALIRLDTKAVKRLSENLDHKVR